MTFLTSLILGWAVLWGLHILIDRPRSPAENKLGIPDRPPTQKEKDDIARDAYFDFDPRHPDYDPETDYFTTSSKPD